MVHPVYLFFLSLRPEIKYWGYLDIVFRYITRVKAATPNVTDVWHFICF